MSKDDGGSKISKNWLIGLLMSIIGGLLGVVGVLIMIGLSDIKTQITEMKTTQTEQAKEQKAMSERLVRVETKVDQLNPDVGPAINRNGGHQ